jgi:8-oxo-dGTP pyrophosphatase MutT (NUDIX family)
MKEFPTVGILVFETNLRRYDTVFLVNNKPEANVPGLSWPGGRLGDKEGKTPVEVAVEELEEETGLRTTPEKLTLWEHGFKPYVSLKGIAYPLLMFLCTEFEGEIGQPTDPNVECSERVNIFSLPRLYREGRLAPRVGLIVPKGRKQLLALNS